MELQPRDTSAVPPHPSSQYALSFYKTSYTKPLRRQPPPLPQQSVRTDVALTAMSAERFKQWPEGADLVEFNGSIQQYYYESQQNNQGTYFNKYQIELNKAPHVDDILVWNDQLQQ
ncbi:MAG: hypothetical protein GY737_07275, partial [Desulfobacteraceae bacterium]|nr:hypothetical protein [Desulfobacteraceae bacterium]